jgi:hypothetical protein
MVSALSRLASIRRDSAARETGIKALRDFINASDCSAHELKANLVLSGLQQRGYHLLVMAWPGEA